MTLTRAQLTTLIADSKTLPKGLRLALPAMLAFLSKAQIEELGEWMEKTLARIESGEIEGVLEEFRESGAIDALHAIGIGQEVIEGVRHDGEELARDHRDSRS